MNVVLIYGGKSGEHEISLMSATSIARNISACHSVTLVSVSKQGKWHLENNELLEKVRNDSSATLSVNENPDNEVSVFFGKGKDSTFFACGKFIPCDVVFPVLHGTYGEDGTVQGVFEMSGVPYVGCDVLGSSCTMDKETTKIMWHNAGLPVVPYVCIRRTQVNDSKLYDQAMEDAVAKLGFPLFVKPCSAGSSDGANKASNKKEFSFALMEAFQWDNKVLVEKAIDAREIECSVTGNAVTQDPSKPCTVLKAYGPGEIVPKHEFYDYDAKYNDPSGAELKIPALLDDEKLEFIRETAKKAYAQVNASGLSRVDFFIDRKTNEIYLNEINTLPGFTSISMFPKMCESAGLKYADLIDYLLEEALAQFDARQSLCTSRV